MNNSIFKISLDVHKPESQVLLNVKKLDTNRTIKISLTENGKPYQITPDCSAVFTAEKADGNKICNDCRIENDVIIYDVTQQTVACTGIVDCEIRLFDPKGSVLTSPRFIILVNERIYNGEEIVESVIEADVLQSLLESRHSHNNKDIIDKITQEMLDMIGPGSGGSGGLTPEQAADLEANTEARHTHENKDVLAAIGQDVDGTFLLGGDTALTTANAYLAEEIDRRGYITANDIPADRIESAEIDIEIEPNTDYVFGECETLTINLANGNQNKRNEYMFTFTSGVTPTVLTLPDTVKWANELTIEANKRYEISIVDNIGLWCAVEVSE